MTEGNISDKSKEVCELITIGYSVERACEKINWHPEYFWSEKAISEELDVRYSRAREKRADARFEKSSKLADDIEIGIVDPQKGRVLLDFVKWHTSKEKPKVYGDKQTIEHEGNLTLSALIMQSALPLENKSQELPAIDIESVDVGKEYI